MDLPVESFPVFSVTFQLKYLIGVFDLWRFEQRTNGNRLGARVWIFENGYSTNLLICWRKWLICDTLEFNQIGYLSGNRMIASKIIEKIIFLWNFFNFLMNNRIKSWENLKTCNDFLRSLGYWDWFQFLEVKKHLFSQLMTSGKVTEKVL